MVNSRVKGRSFEQHVARVLRAWPRISESRRGLTQSRGAIEPDVLATGFPFWIECKACKRVDVKSALAQAARDLDSSKGAEGDFAGGPLVIARDTCGDVFFALPHEPNYTPRWRAALQVIVTRSRLVQASDGGNVFPLIRGATWRNYREHLADADGALVALPGAMIGWLETLERIWHGVG